MPIPLLPFDAFPLLQGLTGIDLLIEFHLTFSALGCISAFFAVLATIASQSTGSYSFCSFFMSSPFFSTSVSDRINSLSVIADLPFPTLDVRPTKLWFSLAQQAPKIIFSSFVVFFLSLSFFDGAYGWPLYIFVGPKSVILPKRFKLYTTLMAVAESLHFW